MTAPHIVDPATVLGEALADASPDLMRHLLQTMINALLSADADAVVGAEWGQPSPDRLTHRNGYRHRDLDTRAGTIDVAIPKLRSGTYFPEWLLERRKRSEAALITVIADCYLAGVSTRRMDKLVKTLGIWTGSSRRRQFFLRGRQSSSRQGRTEHLATGMTGQHSSARTTWASGISDGEQHSR